MNVIFQRHCIDVPFRVAYHQLALQKTYITPKTDPQQPDRNKPHIFDEYSEQDQWHAQTRYHTFPSWHILGVDRREVLRCSRPLSFLLAKYTG